MDADGLQKKILELSKNAAELQVSTLTPGDEDRLVYSGLVGEIASPGR